MKAVELDEFEILFLVELLERQRLQIRGLGIKGTDTIDRILEKLK